MDPDPQSLTSQDHAALHARRRAWWWRSLIPTALVSFGFLAILSNRLLQDDGFVARFLDSSALYTFLGLLSCGWWILCAHRMSALRPGSTPGRRVLGTILMTGVLALCNFVLCLALLFVGCTLGAASGVR